MIENIEKTLVQAADSLRRKQKVFNGSSFYYRQFEIGDRKRRRTRVITAPSHELCKLQRLLLALGIRDMPTHHASTAFRAGCSIAANARQHAAQPYLFKTDIVNFFPSIQVEAISKHIRGAFRTMSADAQAAIIEVVGLDGCLALGAPTSPHLSNVFMRDFDQKLADLSEMVGARYSRYADDIAVSATSSTVLALVADAVRNEVLQLGLQIYEAKTRQFGPSDRKIVTGLDVTTAEIRPTRQFRKKTQAMLRIYLKYRKPGLTEPLKGRIAFWNGVAPHDPALPALRDSLFRAMDEEQAKEPIPKDPW